MAIPGLSLFYKTVDRKFWFNKRCHWLDSKLGLLFSQATAQPIEPQPLPASSLITLPIWHHYSRNKTKSLSFHRYDRYNMRPHTFTSKRGFFNFSCLHHPAVSGSERRPCRHREVSLPQAIGFRESAAPCSPSTWRTSSPSWRISAAAPHRPTSWRTAATKNVRTTICQKFRQCPQKNLGRRVPSRGRIEVLAGGEGG